MPIFTEDKNTIRFESIDAAARITTAEAIELARMVAQAGIDAAAAFGPNVKAEADYGPGGDRVVVTFKPIT